MKYERLFFCNLIFENLNLHIPNTVRFDAVRFLDDASANAFNQFEEEKFGCTNKDFLNYNYTNISITSPEFWREKKDILDCENGPVFSNEEYNTDRDNSIHNHIAYLYASAFLKENLRNESFFALTVGDLDFEIVTVSTTDISRGFWI